MGSEYRETTRRKARRIAARVLAAGDALGLPDAEIAKCLGVTRQSISRYRSGETAPYGVRQQLFAEVAEGWERKFKSNGGLEGLAVRPPAPKPTPPKSGPKFRADVAKVLQDEAIQRPPQVETHSVLGPPGGLRPDVARLLQGEAIEAARREGWRAGYRQGYRDGLKP